jgi:phosphohistidine phosphatase SixA
VKFEERLAAPTALNNYEYLDILDRAWAEHGWTIPRHGVLCDVGCASFWYAATLQHFFQPREMIGVDVEGHRLFASGHTRIDYAAGYLAPLQNARFIVSDYVRCELVADVITAWFPFVTAPAILAWRLPLSLLRPNELFARVAHNMRPGGCFVMVNHGSTEAQIAHTACIAAGLLRRGTFAAAGVLSEHRLQPAVLSVWSDGGRADPRES